MAKQNKLNKNKNLKNKKSKKKSKKLKRKKLNKKRFSKSEKFLITFLFVCIILINSFIYTILKINLSMNKNIENKIVEYKQKGKLIYEVYQNDKIIEIFSDYNEALQYAKKYANSSIKKSGEYKWLWDSNPQFEVYQGYNKLLSFLTYKEALEYAKKYANSYIFYRKNSTFIWDSNINVPKSHSIENVPFISQYPELPRGCEVTSLAMLLNYKGIKVSKMELAEKIKKEPFEFKLKDGKIYNGNPHIGFVGDIYSLKNDGYGVYNEPLYNLLYDYIGTKALNLTGSDFQDLLYYISQDIPIVVIINTKFKPLAKSEFKTLNTTRGGVDITYSEHSVVITGYDDNYIYFNDPMFPNITQKKLKYDFIKAWEQMGKQALTYVN